MSSDVKEVTDTEPSRDPSTSRSVKEKKDTPDVTETGNSVAENEGFGRGDGPNHFQGAQGNHPPASSYDSHEAYNMNQSPFCNEQMSSVSWNPIGFVTSQPAFFYQAPPQFPVDHPTTAMQFYEARMRDHAAAYASAAAGAAWAAAQVAMSAADFAAGHGPPPSHLQQVMDGQITYPPMMMSGNEVQAVEYPPTPPHEQIQETTNKNQRRPARPPSRQASEDDSEAGLYRHQRKKRYQRHDEAPRVVHPSNNRVRRRNLRSDGESSSTSASSYNHHRSRQKKRRSDESMLGKTAVSALYIWCSRQQETPSFLIEPDEDTGGFVCTLDMDDGSYFVGVGRNKNAAKLMASRNALRQKCPEVLLNDETCCVVSVGGDHQIEDLAPNLAKQLAIGTSSNSPSKRTHDDSSASETDVTSDEYFLSVRGSHDLASLFYDIVARDQRFPEQPSFSFELHHGAPQADRGFFICFAAVTKEGEELSAKGIAAGKRDAKRIACARLLAKCFSECESMLHVKVAAENLIAEFDESKQLLRCKTSDGSASVLPKLDQSAPSCVAPTSSLNSFCQFARRRRLDWKVDRALQSMYEVDEVGRTLPKEITQSDVGRTVLRRAEPVDIPHVRCLVSSTHGEYSVKRSPEFLLNEWMPSCSTNSIILLLCRAIAVFDDPPLGCAVLMLDASFQGSSSLRIVRMAREPHLPKERLEDCLRDFATRLGCELVSTDDIPDTVKGASGRPKRGSNFPGHEKAKVTACQKLQSVVEEESNCSTDQEEVKDVKTAAKPNKRSRMS